MTDFAHMFETYSYFILCFFLIDIERQMENTEESNMQKIQTRDSLLSAEGHRRPHSQVCVSGFTAFASHLL